MKKTLILLIPFFLIACAKSESPDAFENKKDTTISTTIEGNTSKVGGAIRFNEGWYLIEDSAHTSLNIDSVITHDGYVEVVFKSNYSKIVSFTVTPDETFAKMGVFVGSSVDTDRAYIYYYRVKNGEVRPLSVDELSQKGSNLWFIGVFEN